MHLTTVVRIVDKLPLWIRVIGWLLVLVNVMGSVSFVTNASAVIPGLGTTGPEQQAATMIAARQIGQAAILAFALLYRDVRVLQAAFVMVIIRESIDLVAGLISGKGLSPIMIGVTIALEAAAFIYLGMIASGRVAADGKRA
jgi:hypothetical protein